MCPWTQTDIQDSNESQRCAWKSLWMRIGNEMYCIILICSMEVTEIKLQTFVMLLWTWELQHSLWAHGSMRRGKEAFLSYSLWRTEAFNCYGVFSISTPSKKQTKIPFPLKMSLIAFRELTHLECISKKCKCTEQLVIKALPQQIIVWNQYFSLGAVGIYCTIFLYAKVGCFDIREFSTRLLSGVKGALTSGNLHCFYLLLTQG